MIFSDDGNRPRAVRGRIHRGRGPARRTVRPDAAARFEAMRAIRRRSAERLQGQEQFTDDDLYDANGLPLLFKGNDFPRTDLTAAV